ncbi:hypothetical protein BDW59DRAFT_161125 [Aspergillus cavernicola]|uniref:Uncharacterized protein n=1 Tax=Aspergillus cavernicola TaxID=176166 RepID=A0ABR4IHD1_9EURO
MATTQIHTWAIPTAGMHTTVKTKGTSFAKLSAYRSLENHINSTMQVNGDDIFITALISQTDKYWFNERWAVFEGISSMLSKTVIVKIRYQLKPHNRKIPYLEARTQDGFDNFHRERRVLQDFGWTSVTPDLIANGQIRQGDDGTCPGAYANVLVMSKVPGQSIVSMRDELTVDDLERIRMQLVFLLESMRIKNWSFDEQERSQIFYDKPAQRMYLVGFSRALQNNIPTDKVSYLTPNSMDILNFGFKHTILTERQTVIPDPYPE